jgi:hypothetical protein
LPHVRTSTLTSLTVNLGIPQSPSSRYAAALLGVDLAKRSVQRHGVEATGAVVLRRAIADDTFVAWCRWRLAPGAVVAMEACASAHHYGRALTAALVPRLPGTLRTLLEQVLEHWAELDTPIDQAEAPITQHARDAAERMEPG